MLLKLMNIQLMLCISRKTQCKALMGALEVLLFQLLSFAVLSKKELLLVSGFSVQTEA